MFSILTLVVYTKIKRNILFRPQPVRWPFSVLIIYKNNVLNNQMVVLYNHGFSLVSILFLQVKPLFLIEDTFCSCISEVH